MYELPFAKRSRWLGGWTLAGIATYSSGLRVNLAVQGNPSNTGGADRPNVVGDWRLSASQRSLARWFDTAAFEANPAFTFGNASRNQMSGPSLSVMDFAIYKTFKINERLRTQFRAEAFNATNTPAFSSPNAQVRNPAFGQINEAGRPRNLQLGLKVIF